MSFLKFLFQSYPKESGYAEIRSVNQDSGACVSKFHPLLDIKGSDELVMAGCDALDRTGRWNHYVGRNVRERCSGTNRDIDWVTAVSFDIDPVRPKGQPSTGQELGEANAAVTRIRETVYQVRSEVMTGNGYQMVYPLKEPVDVRGRRGWWAQANKLWEKATVDSCVVSDLAIAVDPQYDLSRVIKLPGRLSKKGMATTERPWREVVSIESLSRPDLLAEDIIAYATEDEERPTAQIHVGVIPPRFWGLLARDSNLLVTWMGKRTELKDSTGSGHDMALCSILKGRGFTKEEVKAVMSQSPCGKKKYSDSYADYTINKVFGGH